MKYRSQERQLIPKKRLTPVVDHPGYYVVSKFPTIAVNEKGNVIDLDGNPLKVMYSPEANDSYPRVNIPGFGSQTVHRIVASTFIVCHLPEEEAVVNHIDGVKSNNAVSNLEWVTRSENALHAYMAGLRPDNKFILCKNLLTDEVIEFHSLQATARHFGVNGLTVHNYLKSERASPFKKKYVLTEKGTEFPPLTADNVNSHVNGLPKAVMAFVPGTQDVRIFESVGCAAEHVGGNGSLLTYYLHKVRGTDKCVKYLDYEWCFLSDYQGNVDTAGVEVIARPKKTGMPVDSSTGRKVARPPVPLKVVDLATGEVQLWSSTQAFADHIGVKKNTLQKRMQTHNGVWEGYSLEYMAA